MGEPILRRLAREVLGEDKARTVWKRMDIVGDIAIIKMPPGFSLEDAKALAEALVEMLPYVRSVWLAGGPVGGPYRVREGLIHLAGERRTETVYKEHGCRFKVDIAKVFITPRLNYEHMRVARQVGPGEVVVNMFAGAGLFSIIIACYSKPRKIYSIDINEYAYQYMVENCRLNNVCDVVVPIRGDAADVIKERLRGVADRVLMPLPELAIEYLPYALMALRGRGVVHVYLHEHYSKGEDPRVKAKARVIGALRDLGVSSFEVRAVRRVRRVGPRYDQVVVDVWVEV